MQDFTETNFSRMGLGHSQPCMLRATDHQQVHESRQGILPPTGGLFWLADPDNENPHCLFNAFGVVSPQLDGALSLIVAFFPLVFH